MQISRKHIRFAFHFDNFLLFFLPLQREALIRLVEGLVGIDILGKFALFASVAEIVDQELTFSSACLIPIYKVFDREFRDYYRLWRFVSGRASKIFFLRNYRPIAPKQLVRVFELVGGQCVTLVTTPLLVTLLYFVWLCGCGSLHCTLAHLERIGTC